MIMIVTSHNCLAALCLAHNASIICVSSSCCYVLRPVFRANPAWHVFNIVLPSTCMVVCEKSTARYDVLYNTQLVWLLVLG